ncbi:MAG: regulatory protein RecX [Bacteroidota bacterium]|nr:regulatory protein RecX [Bacteroidota bacterium]
MDTKSYTIKEAIKKIEGYCAYQDRCYKEVREKLYEMRLTLEEQDQILVYLAENKFLDEERFAKSFVRGKFNYKNWGRNKLRFELKFREISPYNINKALEEIDDNRYVEVLDELIRKKKVQTKETNIYKLKKKTVDYLLYRGWESNLIYDRIEEIYSEDEQ